MVEQEITQLKVDVGILKTQVGSITMLCDKMDKVIEKLVENQDRMVNQIYKDMQKTEDEKNADVKELHSRITTISRELSEKVELTERRIMNEIKSLREHIIQHNQKEDDAIKKILEWKWMAAGGIIVIVWILSNVSLSSIGKLFN
jgi:acetate kinase